MQKVLLMSILIATIAIPTWHARTGNFAHGLKRTITQMSLFVVLWTLSCIYLYWHL